MRMDTSLCNNVEKAFQSKEQPHSSPKIIQPSPSVYTGLHICPHQEVEIIIFSFRAIRPNSPSPQSSRDPHCVVCVCLHFAQAGGKGDKQGSENRSRAHVAPEATQNQLTAGPGGPFFPGGPGAPMGTSP